MKFDRVETSNIMDYTMSGVERIVQSWAPLLNRSNPHAALLMHSINWKFTAPGASVTGLMLSPGGPQRGLAAIGDFNLVRLLRLVKEYSVRPRCVVCRFQMLMQGS